MKSTWGGGEMRSGKWRREGGGGEEERGVEGDKWENLRHRLFCNQGENLCGRGKITNTLSPLKDSLTLGYLPFGRREFTLAFPHIWGRRKFIHLHVGRT